MRHKPLRGLLIYTAGDAARNRWFIDELRKAAESEGIDLRLCISEETTLPQIAEMQPELVINRSRIAEISAFCEEMLHIRVYNSACVTAVTNDKWETHRFLRAHGLPTADTELIAQRGVYPEMPLPLVAKPTDGHGGAGVEWVGDADALETVLRKKPLPFLLQKPMRTGWDVRIYMLGGKIYRAMLRTSAGLRSNFSLGGSAAPCQPDADMCALADAVQRVLPLDFAGIDLLRHPEGGYVIGEIEDAVGCRMLYQAGGCDPVRDCLRYIAEAEHERRA